MNINININDLVCKTFTEEEIDNCDEELPEEWTNRLMDSLEEQYKLESACVSIMNQMRVHRLK
jgi:hypothetical protein